MSLGLFDGVFAGLWFSHVPIEGRETFFKSLHARLLPGARVIFVENNQVQLRDFPITETDAHGNTYQQRVLPDGSSHRVLKNFPTQDEIRKQLGSRARDFEFRDLENFWLCEYEFVGSPEGLSG